MKTIRLLMGCAAALFALTCAAAETPVSGGLLKFAVGAEPPVQQRHLQRKAGDGHGAARVERFADERGFIATRAPGFRRQFLDAAAGGRLQQAAGRMLFEQHRRRAAGHLQCLLMQPGQRGMPASAFSE